MVQEFVQKLILLRVRVGSHLFRFGNSPGTLLGSLLSLLGLSWEVSRAKKCRQSNARTIFSKIVFSLLGALVGSLGLLLAPPGPVLEPNGSQNGFESDSKIGSKTGLKKT